MLPGAPRAGRGRRYTSELPTTFCRSARPSSIVAKVAQNRGGPRQQHHRHEYARDRVRRAPVYVMVLELQLGPEKRTPQTGIGCPQASAGRGSHVTPARSATYLIVAIRPILHYPRPVKTDSAAVLPDDPATQAVALDLSLPSTPHPVSRWRLNQPYRPRDRRGCLAQKKGETGHGLIVMLPVILALEGRKILREGCLSVPDYATMSCGMTRRWWKAHDTGRPRCDAHHLRVRSARVSAGGPS